MDAHRLVTFSSTAKSVSLLSLKPKPSFWSFLGSILESVWQTLQCARRMFLPALMLPSACFRQFWDRLETPTPAPTVAKLYSVDPKHLGPKPRLYRPLNTCSSPYSKLPQTPKPRKPTKTKNPRSGFSRRIAWTAWICCSEGQDSFAERTIRASRAFEPQQERAQEWSRCC